MAERFTTPIDFNNQPTFGLQIPKLESDPSAPADGDIWLNTTSNLLKIRINGATVTVTVS